MTIQEYVEKCNRKVKTYVAKRQHICAKRLALAMDIIAKTVECDVISRETVEMALKIHHNGRDYSKPTYRK